MDRAEFEKIVAEEFAAMPKKFGEQIRNVAFLIEEEPDQETMREQGLPRSHTLLGLYKGVPNTVRGAAYGIGMTLPDTITLYRLPILSAAGEGEGAIRELVRDTIWHEVAHYFGFDEGAVGGREKGGTNTYIPKKEGKNS